MLFRSMRTDSSNLRTASHLGTNDFGVNPPATFNLQPSTCNPQLGNFNQRTCAEDALPLDEFFEERYARHPKKKDRALAEQAMAEIREIESSQVQDEFCRGHEAWIATDDYTWKGGAKCPTLAEFIQDMTWKYNPHDCSGETNAGARVIDRGLADWRRTAEKDAG